jgi:hypothetical protein
MAETGLNGTAYLDLIAKRADEVLDHETAGYPISLAASWAVAFDRLTADNPAAMQLLTLTAWLAPEPVPMTLYTEQADHLPSRWPRPRPTRSPSPRRRLCCASAPWLALLPTVYSFTESPPRFCKFEAKDPGSTNGPPSRYRSSARPHRRNRRTIQPCGQFGASYCLMSWPQPTPRAEQIRLRTKIPGCSTVLPYISKPAVNPCRSPTVRARLRV